MEHRLLIDHARRRAMLHAADCELYTSRAAHFGSEDTARAALLERLKAGDGASYEFSTDACPGAASAAG